MFSSLARTATECTCVYAEGVMTNGSGMVQFSRGFMRFGRSMPIVPVALRVTVPWNIQTHTLTSSFAANLFWFCFVPWVRLDATVLKPMSLSQVGDAALPRALCIMSAVDD